MENKQKLLITGAFGLVGSNICKVLERDCPDIEIVKLKFDELDKGIFDWKERKLQEYDFIIHAAGYGQPLKFSEDKLKTIYINTDFTRALFYYLKPGGTFLFISSSEVYSGAKSPYKETDIGTTTPQHPRACYIEGKRCGEAIVMANADEFNVKIARLALAYGPGTKKGDTRVLNHFIEQALTTGKIIMKDKGEAIRTYGYIDNVVDQLLFILFKGQSIVYNVGGKSKTTIKNIAETIARITDSQVIEGEEGLEGAPEDVELDLSKVTEEFGLGFASLEHGLGETIKYQKELYDK